MNTQPNNDTASDPSFESVGQGLLNDTSQLQKAFEKAADDATAGILPLPPLPSDENKAVLPPQEAPAAVSATESPDDPVGSWFFTLMCMSIPLVGWIYLIWLAFCKRNTRRRNFARAYLLFKLIFLGISAILLGILIWVSLDILDRLLAYMQML